MPNGVESLLYQELEKKFRDFLLDVDKQKPLNIDHLPESLAGIVMDTLRRKTPVIICKGN